MKARIFGSPAPQFALALSLLSLSQQAAAEKSLMKEGDWEVYTDGRVGGFVSYVRGDGLPRNAIDADGNLLHDIAPGGGLDAQAEREPLGTAGGLTQGTVQSMRIRSGFISNTLGLGVRGVFGDVIFTGYTQVWWFIESDARRKSEPNPADFRQGYAKVEGPWGSFLAGRTRTLLSRGATDIDVMYGHRYGVGFPGESATDNKGPTAGHVGYGVLGSGFASGVVYATPVLAGLQLTVGLFDPAQETGIWTRTELARPEGELTFERALGDLGKFVLFANGGYQKVYRQDSAESTAASGVGYGGRLELGAFHLGVAGHYGTGIGLKYALEPSFASLDSLGNLRKIDGYYVQSQVVLGDVDVSAGWGMARVFLNDADRVRDAQGNIPHSVIKRQMGISAGVVWHVQPWMHLDLDGFRAQSDWFLGEKQVNYIANSGMVFTW